MAPAKSIGAQFSHVADPRGGGGGCRGAGREGGDVPTNHFVCVPYSLLKLADLLRFPHVETFIYGVPHIFFNPYLLLGKPCAGKRSEGETKGMPKKPGPAAIWFKGNTGLARSINGAPAVSEVLLVRNRNGRVARARMCVCVCVFPLKALGDLGGSQANTCALNSTIGFTKEIAFSHSNRFGP